MADLSDVEVKRLLAIANGESKAAPAEEPPKKKPLTGSATKNVNIENTAENLASSMFPAPNDNAMQSAWKMFNMPTAVPGVGLGQMGEDVGNLGLGAAQMGVPQQNRVNIGDLLRMVAPNAITPNEYVRSNAFQGRVQQNPASNIAANAGLLGGSFAFPMGWAESLGLKAVKPIAGAVGPALEYLGKTVPVTRNIPQTARALGYKGGLQTAAKPVAVGAGATAALGAGAKFGSQKELTNPQETAANAVAGGGLSLGIHGLASVLQNMAIKNLIGKLSQQAPSIDATNAAGNARINGHMSDLDLLPPKAMVPKYDAMLNGLETVNMRSPKNRTTQQIASTQQKVLKRAVKRYGASEEHQEGLAKVQQSYSRSQVRQQDKLQGRVEKDAEFKKKEQSQIAKEQRTQTGKQKDTQGKEGKATTHTAESGSAYRDLYGQIDGAEGDALSSIEQDINDAGHTPDGQPVLKAWQRSNLMARLRSRRRELGAEPGENKGAGQGSTPAPKGTEPKVKGTQPKGTEPVVKPSETPKIPVAKPTEIESFLTGLDRKTLAPALMPGVDRYKVAISVDALGKVANLEQHEVTALKHAVSALSEVAVEKKATQASLDRLAGWALENSEAMSPKEHGITKTYIPDGIQLQKEGFAKRLSLTAKLEERVAREHREQITMQRHVLWEEGRERGDLSTEDLAVDKRPSVNVTVNGRVAADGWHAKENGGLALSGSIEKVGAPGDFVPPKNLDDLFMRGSKLVNRLHHLEIEDAAIRNAQGEHDYLGDGTKPVDIMEKAFKNRQDLYKKGTDPGDVPTANVWHADEIGDHAYITTVRFDRRKIRTNFNEATKDLTDRLKQFEQEVKDKHGYEKAVFSGSLKAFSGLEAAPLIALALSRKASELAVKTGLADTAVAKMCRVGTAIDIIADKPQFRGEQVENKFYRMLGNVLHEFLRDDGTLYSRIVSGEQLTGMLNKFKNVEISTRSYQKHLVKVAQAEGRVSEAEIQDARREGRTAAMIRMQWKKLAEEIKPLLEQMDMRKNHVGARHIPADEMKIYQPEEIGTDGKPRRDAYDALFHDCLRLMHNGLSLKPGEDSNAVSRFFGSLVARQNASFFANAFRVATGNFFDAGIPTLMEFHRHAIRGFVEIIRNPEVRELLGRVPSSPQADMDRIALEEARAARPEPSKPMEHVLKAWEDVNHWLGTTADPFFHGAERVVSAPDRFYSRVVTYASLSRQGEALGYDGVDFLREMAKGDTFSKEERIAFLGKAAKDLTQFFNSVAPSVNRDPIAHNPIGKLWYAYSAPMRRNLRIYLNWAREGGLGNWMKLLGAYGMLVAVSGRGAVPKSLQNTLGLIGAQTGHAQDVEQSLQDLDNANILRRSTNLDLADRVGSDLLNVASPTSEALLQYHDKAKHILATEPDNKALADLGFLTFGKTLALFPRIFGFGYTQWSSGYTNLEAAAKGQKKYYTEIDGKLRSIPVGGYSVGDAVRDTVFPAMDSSAWVRRNAMRMQAAQKSDMTKRQARNTIAPSNGSLIESLGFHRNKEL